MRSTTITVYGIPNCDTVKKARAWLAAQGINHRFHDLKKEGVPADHLRRWLAEVGWEKLINRQGTTWRRLAPEAQAAVDGPAGAADLARQQPSVIKRPVVEWSEGGPVTVGFSAERWAELAAR
ncbi:arsenate reductase [Xylophilus sp.]|uniref:arsenate reductase n=1 Tax=Xylophilus sp. TaxID=2653893 RepID=UPI0013B65A2C|nr:arsenate reductase [Xylophilus sp.]KAF1049490.1 MAG: Protein YffB [Xylophilus sp.]